MIVASPALDALRPHLGDVPAWVVGGAVREALLHRAAHDVDVAVGGPPEAAGDLARAAARTAGAHPFRLSDAFGAWRVTAADGDWQLDLTPLQGSDLADDLGRRDLTVNAMAVPVAGGDVADPHGGADDLRAGRLRAVSDGSFAADPVRVARLCRFAARTGWAPDPATADLARAAAPAVREAPGERLVPELELLATGPHAGAAWRLADDVGLLGVLAAPDGPPRPLLVDEDHALLAALAAPDATVPEAAPADREALARRRADDADRLGLALAVLARRAGGAGEDGVRELLDGLRPSRALRRTVERAVAACAALPAVPADADDRVLHDAVRPLGPDGPSAVLLARLAAGTTPAPWAALAARAVRWAGAPPRSPVDGGRLARELGLTPGPRLGALLEELAIAADAGRATGPEDALALARELLAGA